MKLRKILINYNFYNCSKGNLLKLLEDIGNKTNLNLKKRSANSISASDRIYCYFDRDNLVWYREASEGASERGGSPREFIGKCFVTNNPGRQT